MTNVVVFWKQQVLTLFKPRAPVSGAHESWAPCSQEGPSPSLRVTLTEHLVIRLWFKLCRGVVVWLLLLGTSREQHGRGPTNSVTGLWWPPRASIRWLSLQGALRHFLKFLPQEDYIQATQSNFKFSCLGSVRLFSFFSSSFQLHSWLSPC